MSPAEIEILLDLIDDDPCTAVRKITALKLSLITTGTVQKIEFRDRSTWFHPNGNVGDALDDLIRQAAAACALKTGKASQFAITLGGGRRRGYRGC